MKKLRYHDASVLFVEPVDEKEKTLDEIYGPDKRQPDRWGFAEHRAAQEREESARRPFVQFRRLKRKPGQSSA